MFDGVKCFTLENKQYENHKSYQATSYKCTSDNSISFDYDGTNIKCDDNSQIVNIPNSEYQVNCPDSIELYCVGPPKKLFIDKIVDKVLGIQKDPTQPPCGVDYWPCKNGN